MVVVLLSTKEEEEEKEKRKKDKDNAFSRKFRITGGEVINHKFIEVDRDRRLV
jgi:hypothetical protein